MAEALHELTLGKRSRSIREGELSPLEATRYFLGRIATIDRRLCAVRVPLRERALAGGFPCGDTRSSMARQGGHRSAA